MKQSNGIIKVDADLNRESIITIIKDLKNLEGYAKHGDYDELYTKMIAADSEQLNLIKDALRVVNGLLIETALPE